MRALQIIFHCILIRPFIWIGLGVNVRHMERLPHSGPAILVANHNSHLDTMVILSLFPLRHLHRVHPVAAADYFLKNRALQWFAETVFGIIPIDRSCSSVKTNPLQPCLNALENNQILLLFPEGTRGDPERMARLKTGIAHLARHAPDAPVIPLYIHGCGRSLPKGETLFVPHICDLAVGSPLPRTDRRTNFMNTLKENFDRLRDELNIQEPCDNQETFHD